MLSHLRFIFIPTSATVRSFLDLMNIKIKLHSFAVLNLAEYTPIYSHTSYLSINIAILCLHVEPSLAYKGGAFPFSWRSPDYDAVMTSRSGSNGKIIPELLSTTPGRHMREWRHSSTQS
jgi:hypothetical protein